MTENCQSLPDQDRCEAVKTHPRARCEKPVGHDGYHEAHIGHLIDLAWGVPVAREALNGGETQ